MKTIELTNEELLLLMRSIDTRQIRLLEVKKELDSIVRNDPTIMEEYYALCDIYKKLMIDEDKQ